MGFGTANHFQKLMTTLPAMQSPQLIGGYSLSRLMHWRWLFLQIKHDRYLQAKIQLGHFAIFANFRLIFEMAIST
jgi:hypothetical protein